MYKNIIYKCSFIIDSLEFIFEALLKIVDKKNNVLVVLNTIGIQNSKTLPHHTNYAPNSVFTTTPLDNNRLKILTEYDIV